MAAPTVLKSDERPQLRHVEKGCTTCLFEIISLEQVEVDGVAH
jgi:hypothetical protein